MIATCGTTAQSACEALNQVRQDIEERRQKEVRKAEQKLEELGLPAADDSYRRVKECLRVGDVRTADDFLVSLQEGKALPEIEDSTSDLAFFPDFLESISSMDRVITSAAANRARQRESVELVDFADFPAEQAKEIEELMRSWLQLAKEPARGLKGKVSGLLRGLGFEAVRIRVQAGSAHNASTICSVEVSPIKDPGVCPIPRFGSEAKGHYTVVVLKGKPVGMDIVAAARAERKRETPVIALFLGLMGANARRRLFRDCRQERQSVLVLDEGLLFYACREPERRERLAAFFRNACQFTVANPYTTTAGFVPDEMFYGRQHELERIIGRNNDHLLFGGRQLGKTALLLQAQRLYDKPDEGRIVRWMDLENHHGIGVTRPITDLWTVIASVLHDAGVIGSQVKLFATIRAKVKEWLAEDHRRQIVLLLDEADRFLRSDGKDGGTSGVNSRWSHTRQLKTLCEETDRRFKFVFAGLHNVQRSSRDSNARGHSDEVVEIPARMCKGFLGV